MARKRPLNPNTLSGRYAALVALLRPHQKAKETFTATLARILEEHAADRARLRSLTTDLEPTIMTDALEAELARRRAERAHSELRSER